MPRQVRDSRIETRTARFRLSRNKRYWRAIREGLAIGYRRGDRTSSWYVRVLLPDGRYTVRSLATADDHADADGKRVLSFQQAQRAAHGVAERLTDDDGGRAPDDDPTVDEILDDYLAWHRAQSNAWQATRYILDRFIRKSFGRKRVSELTRASVQRWFARQAATDSDDPELRRRKRATANRRLTVLKAALNYGYHGPSEIKDAWREVKPFRAVDAPKVRFLTEDECRRLLNASAPDLRQLVRAALLTGARYGELARLTAADFDAEAAVITVQMGKSGKGRHIPLTDEAVAFFAQLAAGSAPGDRILTRTDGEPWRKNYQVRPLKAACEAARIEPAISFHILRHTYGSLLARKGVPLQVIAAAMGHADTRMTERHYAHLQPDFVADTIRANLPRFGLDSSNIVAMTG